MKLDALKQFSRLRTALVEEQAVLERRLAKINEVLNQPTSANSVTTEGQPARLQRARLTKRQRGGLTLRKAILQAIKSKPLTKEEILDGVKRIGYKFSTTRPMATLNAYLYQKGAFSRRNGRFGPGKRAR